MLMGRFLSSSLLGFQSRGIVDDWFGGVIYLDYIILKNIATGKDEIRSVPTSFLLEPAELRC